MNKMYRIEILIISSLILSLTFTQGCTPLIQASSTLASIPQLQAGSITLEYSGTPQRITNFNVTLKNTTILNSRQFEVAVGLSYIQNYFDPSSLDFGVRAIPYPSLFTVVWIISESASWASAHIHYLATAREDVRAQTFIADNSQLLNQVNSSNYTIRVSSYFGNRKWNASSKFIIVNAYLSGIKCNDRFMDIRVAASGANLTESVVNVTLAVGSQEAPIEMLYVSYVMYTDINSPVNIQAIGNVVLSAENSFTTHVENTFIGIYKISAKALSSFFQGQTVNQSANNNNNNTTQKRLLATVLNKVNLENFAASFELQGFTITAKEFFEGPILTESSNLQTNRTGCANYTECSRIGGVFVTTNNEIKCILCRANSEYNPDSKTCTCKSGYFLSQNNNTCISFESLCGQNNIYLNGSCYQLATSPTCSENKVYNSTTRSCQCPTNFISYTRNSVLKCVAPCENGLSFNFTTEKCACFSGLFDSNNVCINCQDDLAKWNAEKKQCECVSGTYNFLGGKCQVCSQFGQFNNETKRCECSEGYSGNGIVCRKVEKASNSLTRDFTIIYSKP